MKYVVVIIETGSDDPGITDIYGPFDSDYAAAMFANGLAASTGLRRGHEIQAGPIKATSEKASFIYTNAPTN